MSSLIARLVALPIVALLSVVLAACGGTATPSDTTQSPLLDGEMQLSYTLDGRQLTIDVDAGSTFAEAGELISVGCLSGLADAASANDTDKAVAAMGKVRWPQAGESVTVKLDKTLPVEPDACVASSGDESSFSTAFGSAAARRAYRKLSNQPARHAAASSARQMMSVVFKDAKAEAVMNGGQFPPIVKLAPAIREAEPQFDVRVASDRSQVAEELVIYVLADVSDEATQLHFAVRGRDGVIYEMHYDDATGTPTFS